MLKEERNQEFTTDSVGIIITIIKARDIIKKNSNSLLFNSVMSEILIKLIRYEHDNDKYFITLT